MSKSKKITPVKFFQEVKQEGAKVTWPNRKETIASTGMVLVMVVIAATFFFFVDWIVSSTIQTALGL